MMDHEFLNKYDVAQNHAEAASGTTTITGSTIDMANFDALVIMARVSTANAANYMYLEHGDESDLSDAANVASSKALPTNNNEIAAVEIIKPIKRYARAYVVRGSATAVGSMLALREQARKKPADCTVDGQIRGKVLISPDSGDI
jgi:hypothetical protein